MVQQSSMRLELTVGPTIEPLTLEEAKSQLIVSTTADDTLITSLITVARRKVEQDTGLQLITATYNGFLDAFPCGRGEIRIPIYPVAGLNEIHYVDLNGDSQTIVKEDVQLEEFARPAIIVPLSGESWPSTKAETLRAVTVDFDAGYGDAASNVPGDLIHAIKLVLTHLYEHRGDDDAPEFRSSAYEALIGPYKSMEYR